MRDEPVLTAFRQLVGDLVANLPAEVRHAQAHLDTLTSTCAAQWIEAYQDYQSAGRNVSLSQSEVSDEDMESKFGSGSSIAGSSADSDSTGDHTVIATVILAGQFKVRSVGRASFSQFTSAFRITACLHPSTPFVPRQRQISSRLSRLT